MPDVVVQIPLLDTLDGFEDAGRFYGALKGLFAIVSPKGWHRRAPGVGGFQGVEDDVLEYSFDGLPSERLNGLRIILGLVRCLTSQNAIYLKVDGQPETIGRESELVWTDAWATATRPDRGLEYVTRFRAYSQMILDDIVLLKHSFSPPIDGQRYPGTHDECPLSADREVIRHLVEDLSRHGGPGRDVGARVGTNLVSQQPLPLEGLGYAPDGGIELAARGETQTICPSNGQDTDQPHWGIWPESDIRTDSSDVKWWRRLRFFPTTYRYNKALEKLLRRAGLVGAGSLEDAYLGKAGFVRDHGRLRLEPGADSLNFTTHWINRAVAQITIITRDDRFILAKRRDSQDYYRDYWDATLGEALQPVRWTGGTWVPGDRCLVDAFRNAVSEEFRLPRLDEHLERIAVTAFGREWDNGITSIFGTIWLRISADTLINEVKGRISEAAAIASVDRSRIPDICGQVSWEPSMNDGDRIHELVEGTNLRGHWTGHARLKLLFSLFAHALYNSDRSPGRDHLA